MARWLVSTNDTHFEVDGVDKLRELARAGSLGPGDMVQKPGDSKWLYAIEIPELKPLLQTIAAVDAESAAPASGGGGGMVKAVAAVVLLAVAGGGFFKAWEFYQQRPSVAQAVVDTLTLQQLYVTGDGAQLLADASPRAAVVAPVDKNAVLELLAKRGGYYQARDAKSGQEGWVALNQVLPMYLLGGGEAMKQYDPLYNPDRYVNVGNGSWMQLPETRKEPQPTTVFQFMLSNESMYDMTDVVVLTQIKDAQGHDLEDVEIKVGGIVPRNGSTMVGTLVDPTTKEKQIITQTSFDVLAAQTPDLALAYTLGVEVPMTTADFTEAKMDVVQLRAIPTTESAPTEPTPAE